MSSAVNVSECIATLITHMEFKCWYCCSVYRSVSHLGSGQFGNVDKGLWRSSNNKAVEVALKSLTKGASDVDEVKFLQEAAVMAQFKHPNVISLYGVVSEGQPVSFAKLNRHTLCLDA